jgi:hypothetical protein
MASKKQSISPHLNKSQVKESTPPHKKLALSTSSLKKPVKSVHLKVPTRRYPVESEFHARTREDIKLTCSKRELLPVEVNGDPIWSDRECQESIGLQRYLQTPLLKPFRSN